MKKAISLVMLITIVFTYSVQGQNQSNMYYRGDLSNSPTWDGIPMTYRLLGIPTWKTTIQEDETNTSSEFKFSDDATNWTNQWSNNSLLSYDTKTTFPKDQSNSSISTTENKYYTFTWVDVSDFVSSFVYVMETSAEPVTITDVSQLPEANSVDENDDVVVTTETNTIPCDEEHIYVRYTTDNWTSSSLEELDFGDPKTSIGTATIPSQNSAEKSTSYYVFSTTLLDPTNSYDEMTINYDNNNNTNYAYTTLHSTANHGDWHTESTWTSNVVPASDDDVIISHDVTITAASEINNITVESGASVEYDASANHTIHGSVLVYGNARVNNNNFIHVEGWMWVLFTGDLTIRAGGELTVDGTTTNNGAFTIESNSGSTGSFIPKNTVSAINDITVERYIGAWSGDASGWHLLSSPMVSQNISPEFVDISGTISNSLDFYRWEETAITEGWINIKNSGGTYNQGAGSEYFSSSADPAFSLGEGYLVAYGSNQTKEFTGTINNTTVVMSGLTYTDASSYTGWNLIGNPFSSALKWDDTHTSWNRNNVDGNAKIWDETIASYEDIAQSEIIPAMQGFMVHVTDPGPGSLNIFEGDRTHDSQNWYKNSTVNKIVLTAYDNEGSTAQESKILINENASIGFDSEYDSWFLAGYAPQFYSVIGEGSLSTNSIPEITSQTTIPISFIKNGSSTYTIEAEGVNNLNPQEDVYLTDLKTNHTQLLNDNPVYDFSSEEDDINERFIIHFSPLAINNLSASEDISVVSSNNNIEIRSNKPINAKINIYTISGQLIKSTKLDNQSSTTINVSEYKGAAIISIITSRQTHNEKVIIW